MTLEPASCFLHCFLVAIDTKSAQNGRPTHALETTLACDWLPAQSFGCWFQQASNESLELVVIVCVEQNVRHARQIRY